MGFATPKVNLTLYHGTGRDLYHTRVHKDGSLPSASTDIVDGVFTWAGVGIATVRVKSPFSRLDPNTNDTTYDDTIDYATITGSSLLLTGIDTLCFFVTNVTHLSASVIELSLMLDCLGTLGEERLGINYVLTRSTLGVDTLKDTRNTIVEPFTPMSPYLCEIHETDASNKGTFRPVIISPYKLDGKINDILKINKISDTGTKTSDTTNYLAPYAVKAEHETKFSNYSDDTAKSIGGQCAYDPTEVDVKSNISALFAAGVSNVVTDAYMVHADAALMDGAFLNLQGETKTASITGLPKFDVSDKSSYYGKYITLVSKSSGESITSPVIDVLSNLGTIPLAYSVDPSPNGRMYCNFLGNYSGTPSEKDIMRIAMRGVRSTTWQRYSFGITSGSYGVTLGQTFKFAELGLNNRINELSRKATEAKYDFSTGNGYLLKSTGNEYALQSLDVRQQNQDTTYNLSQTSNYVANVASALNTGLGVLESGKLSGLVSGVNNSIQLALQHSQNTANYEAQNALNSINKGQLTDQGEYNLSNLRAQSAAAEAVANANIAHNGILQNQLANYSEIPVYGYPSEGLAQYAGTSDFYVILSGYSRADSGRLKQCMANFGRAVYVPNGSLEGSFSKIGEVSRVKNSAGNQYPSWIVNGAISQLQAGVWDYG